MALLKSAAGPLACFGASDVGQTTHLGPVIKETGGFAPRDLDDHLDWLRDAGALAVRGGYWLAGTQGIARRRQRQIDPGQVQSSSDW